jgi:adenylate cyclase class 2
MIEVEIKVRIEDPDLIRKKFKENHGDYKFSLVHEDTYYNMPKGLRDFEKTDEALRIRKSIQYDKDKTGKEKEPNYFLTYKGKKMDNSTKSREEIDLKIENLNKMREILNILGFQEILTVRKKRELHEFEFKTHKIEALIDYLPIMKQYFIEVEYLTESLDKIEESKEILFDLLSRFGIQREESITKSYLELIIENTHS